MSTEERDSAMQKQLKLNLVRISPCCRIVWLYMLQNKLPVEIKDVDVLEGEHRSDNFTALNPHQEVPVLVDGKTVVFEGIAILRYLANKYTSYSGWGKNMGDKANILSVMNWACCNLHRVLGYRYVYPHFLEKYHLKTQDDTELMVEKAAEQLTKHLEVLEKFYLKTSPFLCGKELTLADSYVATILCQAEWLDFDLALWPRVLAWFNKVKGQEYWSKVHEKHEEFLQRLRKLPHE